MSLLQELQDINKWLDQIIWEVNKFNETIEDLSARYADRYSDSQNHRDTADYWVKYFYSKSWEESERQWITVRNILDRILEELGEENV